MALIIFIKMFYFLFFTQSPSFKFSRKASSSYSLKLEPPNKQNKVKTKRKPLSTPASPSRSREPQCTCMTADQYARLRAQDPRYRGELHPTVDPKRYSFLLASKECASSTSSSCCCFLFFFKLPSFAFFFFIFRLVW